MRSALPPSPVRVSRPRAPERGGKEAAPASGQSGRTTAQQIFQANPAGGMNPAPRAGEAASGCRGAAQDAFDPSKAAGGAPGLTP
jgi:hypothetical protein